MTERRHEVTRLEGFGDAVFGLALTLLVWCEHNKFFRCYGLQDAWAALLDPVRLLIVLGYSAAGTARA